MWVVAESDRFAGDLPDGIQLHGDIEKGAAAELAVLTQTIKFRENRLGSSIEHAKYCVITGVARLQVGLVHIEQQKFCGEADQ